MNARIIKWGFTFVFLLIVTGVCMFYMRQPPNPGGLTERRQQESLLLEKMKK